MLHDNTAKRAPAPDDHERCCSFVFEDDGPAQEWPGPDAAMVLDGDYDLDELALRERKSRSVTSVLQIAQNFELVDWVRELRDEQRFRERLALLRLAACRCSSLGPIRGTHRRAPRRAAAKAAVNAAGGDDPDPEPGRVGCGVALTLCVWGEVRHVG